MREGKRARHTLSAPSVNKGVKFIVKKFNLKKQNLKAVLVFSGGSGVAAKCWRETRWSARDKEELSACSSTSALCTLEEKFVYTLFGIRHAAVDEIKRWVQYRNKVEEWLILLFASSHTGLIESFNWNLDTPLNQWPDENANGGFDANISALRVGGQGRKTRSYLCILRAKQSQSFLVGLYCPHVPLCISNKAAPLKRGINNWK